MAWDISHPFDPASYKPKELAARRRFEAVYAGSIVEDKGVAELIRTMATAARAGHRSALFTGRPPATSTQCRRSAQRSACRNLLSFVRLIGNAEVLSMMVAADSGLSCLARTEYPEELAHWRCSRPSPLARRSCAAIIRCSVHDNSARPQCERVFGRRLSAFAAAMRRTLTDAALYAALSANAPSTWAALKGPADWRTLIFKWVVEGRSSP